MSARAAMPVIELDRGQRKVLLAYSGLTRHAGWALGYSDASVMSGFSYDYTAQLADQLAAQGLIEIDGMRVTMTAAGVTQVNHILGRS